VGGALSAAQTAATLNAIEAKEVHAVLALPDALTIFMPPGAVPATLRQVHAALNPAAL